MNKKFYTGRRTESMRAFKQTFGVPFKHKALWPQPIPNDEVAFRLEDETGRKVMIVYFLGSALTTYEIVKND